MCVRERDREGEGGRKERERERERGGGKRRRTVVDGSSQRRSFGPRDFFGSAPLVILRSVLGAAFWLFYPWWKGKAVENECPGSIHGCDGSGGNKSRQKIN